MSQPNNNRETNILKLFVQHSNHFNFIKFQHLTQSIYKAERESVPFYHFLWLNRFSGTTHSILYYIHYIINILLVLTALYVLWYSLDAIIVITKGNLLSDSINMALNVQCFEHCDSSCFCWAISATGIAINSIQHTFIPHTEYAGDMIVTKGLSSAAFCIFFSFLFFYYNIHTWVVHSVESKCCINVLCVYELYDGFLLYYKPFRIGKFLLKYLRSHFSSTAIHICHAVGMSVVRASETNMRWMGKANDKEEQKYRLSQKLRWTTCGMEYTQLCKWATRNKTWNTQ